MSAFSGYVRPANGNNGEAVCRGMAESGQSAFGWDGAKRHSLPAAAGLKSSKSSATGQKLELTL